MSTFFCCIIVISFIAFILFVPPSSILFSAFLNSIFWFSRILENANNSRGLAKVAIEPVVPESPHFWQWKREKRFSILKIYFFAVASNACFCPCFSIARKGGAHFVLASSLAWPGFWWGVMVVLFSPSKFLLLNQRNSSSSSTLRQGLAFERGSKKKVHLNLNTESAS